MHTYKTIDGPSEGFYKEKGSKFIAYAYPANDITEIKTHLASVKKIHHKARHHCLAYRYGITQIVERANDDGEPSGTAGQPILGQIHRFELHNILIVVVRYFGGTKLGTGGLIRAYKAAAEDAIENATIISKDVTVVYQCRCPVEDAHKVLQFLSSSNDVDLLDQVYDSKAYSVRLKLPLKERDQLLHILRCHLLAFPPSAEDIPPLPDSMILVPEEQVSE